MPLTSNFNQEPSPEKSETISGEKLPKVEKKFFKESFRIVKILKVLICLIFVFLVLYFFWSNFGLGLRGRKTAWQAVFLSNGQVYFGKIIRETKNILVLQDVYYLQVTQEGGEKNVQPQLSLIKLGEEPHRPEDEMRINKEHILFVEDLKPDSEVVRIIEEFKKRK